jgi:pyridoxamine 5'-phosphate oxidase
MGTNGKIKQEVTDYIESTKLAELATVRSDGAPVVRTMGAFAPADGGATIYFSTLPAAEKTQHIRGNHKVSFLFQHEGQSLPEFQNVAIIGNAAQVTEEAEIAQAAALISARSPFVKERIAKEGRSFFAFYKVSATEIKYLDYRKGVGPQAIEIITL